MQDPAVPHELAARDHRDDFAGRRDAVLQRHGPSPQPARTRCRNAAPRTRPF
jgi:hypothetical protein